MLRRGYLYKPDFQPLLSAGRHEMTAGDFETRFVIELGGANRPAIWAKFRHHIIDAIDQLDIKCELWIDGSFITRCPEPEDIDGSLMVAHDHIDTLNDASLFFLQQFDDSAQPFDEALDIYLCPVFPKGDPLRGDLNDPDGWAKQWSSEHNSSWLKGFVVLPFR